MCSNENRVKYRYDRLVKERFPEQYKGPGSLRRDVESETTGSYQQALLAVLDGSSRMADKRRSLFYAILVPAHLYFRRLQSLHTCTLRDARASASVASASDARAVVCHWQFRDFS